jgi:hypothetical protein
MSNNSSEPTIRTHCPSREYDKGWDRIFGKKDEPAPSPVVASEEDDDRLPDWQLTKLERGGTALRDVRPDAVLEVEVIDRTIYIRVEDRFVFCTVPAEIVAEVLRMGGYTVTR